MQNRTSDLGKLYDTMQSNKHLDKFVFDITSLVEFSIKCGDNLPFNIELKKGFDISEQDVSYIKGVLNKRGVVVSNIITQTYKYIITVDDLL